MPRAVAIAIAAAWTLAIIAQGTGTAGVLHHDALIEGDLPGAVAVGLSIVAWQAMVAAMMLPSSLPLVRMFDAVSASQEQRAAVMGAFLGGYVLVWTAFGALAFAGDAAVHALVDGSAWLEARTWLIGGSVLVATGAFQFTALKDRCLEKCRNPGLFLNRRYRRGIGAAFELGRDHGLFCLGCCWALMVVMFAAGVGNLWWMAALTALMVYEKTAPGGRRSVPVTGIAFLAWGAVVLAHPAWLPDAFYGAL